MRNLRSKHAMLCLCSFALTASLAEAQGYDVHEIPLPPGAVQVYVPQISNLGEVCGYYVTASNQTQGYYKTLFGPEVAPVIDPNDNDHYTVLHGLNDEGTITGVYTKTNVQHGLILENGVFTTYDLPGSLATQLTAINDLGFILGNGYNTLEYGFILASNGSVLVSGIDYKNQNTYAQGLNLFLEVVGFSVDSSNNGWGYYRDPSGNMTAILPPGSVSTYPASINDLGVIVGYYKDSSGIEHGFTLRRGTTSYEIFDVPGATGTTIGGVNDLGWISGHYQESSGNWHAYYATPEVW